MQDNAGLRRGDKFLLAVERTRQAAITPVAQKG